MEESFQTFRTISDIQGVFKFGQTSRDPGTSIIDHTHLKVSVSPHLGPILVVFHKDNVPGCRIGSQRRITAYPLPTAGLIPNNVEYRTRYHMATCTLLTRVPGGGNRVLNCLNWSYYHEGMCTRVVWSHFGSHDVWKTSSVSRALSKYIY